MISLKPIKVFIVLRVDPLQICRPVAVRTRMCAAIDASEELQYNFRNMRFAILPWNCYDVDALTDEANSNLKSLLK